MKQPRPPFALSLVLLASLTLAIHAYEADRTILKGLGGWVVPPPAGARGDEDIGVILVQGEQYCYQG